MVNNTSKMPSIVLISSLAALIPAPTRAIYSATKAASLVLYQALSVEHPRIKFTNVVPYTIEGDFRASAVDAGPVREANPNEGGLKKEYVARRCIQAADDRERDIFLPFNMRYGHLLYWLYPTWVERKAAEKYHFSA